MNDIKMYNYITKQLRTFFQDQKGYVEIPSQSRLSILAACEDPETISQFVFNGVNYPLPQTGQMWLEIELLKNPNLKGVFCQTTSYRNERFPIPGRHDKIFPMFEFESHGGFNDLKKIEAELLSFLGFAAPVALTYNNTCKLYSTDVLTAAHEERMCKDFGNVISLERFPQQTHPFWNMKRDNDGIYNKVDIILYDQETIGSAERSTDIEQMRDTFYTISEGKYAQLLFSSFGQERVTKELDEYLALPMIPRFGVGIGVTRMARALKLAHLDAQAEFYFQQYRETGKTVESL
jgi:aspartyl/asparaginyl-tRNA synthetase